MCSDGTYGCRKAVVIGTEPIGILMSTILKTYRFNVTIVNRRELYPFEKEIINLVGLKFYNSAKYLIQHQT